MGLAVGWSCVVLAYGKKGLRKSLPHSLGEDPGDGYEHGEPCSRGMPAFSEFKSTTARVLHGPEGSAMVSLNKSTTSKGIMPSSGMYDVGVICGELQTHQYRFGEVAS